jgi:hypothetical protein
MVVLGSGWDLQIDRRDDGPIEVPGIGVSSSYSSNANGLAILGQAASLSKEFELGHQLQSIERIRHSFKSDTQFCQGDNLSDRCSTQYHGAELARRTTHLGVPPA